MPKNVEIKARAIDFNAQKLIASRLSNTHLETLTQRDTFFKIAEDRLKLRVFDDKYGQLILYRRADQAGPKVSDYQITKTADPFALKQILSDAYGVVGQVNKTRYLYMSSRTRLHFDQVEGLGESIELEVVLDDDENPKNGELEAQDLMKVLNIQPNHLINVAYIDLIAKLEK